MVRCAGLGKVFNRCLEPININSVLVAFNVSLLETSQLLTDSRSAFKISSMAVISLPENVLPVGGTLWRTYTRMFYNWVLMLKTESLLTLSPLQIVLYKNVISPHDGSGVNFFVAWCLFACSMNCSTTSPLVFQRGKISSCNVSKRALC